MRTFYEEKNSIQISIQNFSAILFYRIFFFLESFWVYEDSSFIEIGAFFFVETFCQKISEVPETLKENVLVKQNVIKIRFFSYVSEHPASLGSKTQFGHFWGRKIRINRKGIRQVVLWESLCRLLITLVISYLFHYNEDMM